MIFAEREENDGQRTLVLEIACEAYYGEVVSAVDVETGAPVDVTEVRIPQIELNEWAAQAWADYVGSR